MHFGHIQWHAAGCSIAILVENGQVYFAHIQPRASGSVPGQSDRGDLAQNLLQVGGFEGIVQTDPRHYIVYGGNEVNQVSC